MSSASLLIVESEPLALRALTEQLRAIEGFAVVAAGSGSSALSLLHERTFDLLIVGADLHDMAVDEFSGRANLVSNATIVLMTSRSGSADPPSGIHDSIERPFRLQHLLGRIEAHLRARQGSEARPASIGPYEFRPAAKLLVHASGERTVRLTEKETAILEFLVRAGEQPTGRELLLNEVWGYHPDVTTHTLETHVYRLRQKIEADPARAEILVSEAGGYRLVS